MDGVLYQGDGSGYVRSTYFLDPSTSLLIKARDDHVQIHYITDNDDCAVTNRSLTNSGFSDGHCLVFINAWSSEGGDRRNLSAYHNRQ